MRFFLLFFVGTLIFFLAATTIEAKVLPQAKGTRKTIAPRATSGITVSPRLRSDRKALVVNFGNLINATSVSYTLIYQTNGQEEGAGGTISSAGSTAQRELLFGTCSKNVCRYHSNITNMRLEVKTTLTSGKKTLKRYRIRV